MNKPVCLVSILKNISSRLFLYLNTRNKYSECAQVQIGDACFSKFKVTSRVKTGNRNCENTLVFLKPFETQARRKQYTGTSPKFCHLRVLLVKFLGYFMQNELRMLPAWTDDANNPY